MEREDKFKNILHQNDIRNDIQHGGKNLAKKSML
jgi:hypothetical protein